MNTIIDTLNAAGSRALDFAWPALWQSSLLIAGLFVLDRLCRHKVRATVLYALWLVVLAKLLMPPSFALPTGLGWWLRSAAPPPVTQSLPVVVSYGSEAAFDVPTPPAPIRTEPSPTRLTNAAVGLLMSCAISLGLLGWMLIRWRTVAREAREASPATPELEALLAEARAIAGRRRRVPLRLVDKPVSPAVCGLLRPTILLPRLLARQLSPAQLRVVLVHELVHVRRGDVWVNLFQALLQVAFWWHPLLWPANARLRQLREEAVDDSVMQLLAGEAETYAPTLLDVARLALQRPLASLGLVGILESRSSLHQRIKRLVDLQPPRKAGMTLGAALGVLAFAAVALPMGEGPARTGSASDSPPAIGGTESNLLAPTDLAPVPRSNGGAAATLIRDGKLLYEMGKLTLAEAKLREAIREDPGSPAASYYLELVRQARLRQLANQDPSPTGKGQSRTNRIASNRGRQAILAKLNELRLESIGMDGMPLGEVLKNLSEEIRKRDPEQRGINLVLNPNLDSGASSGTIDPATGLATLPTNSVNTRDLSRVLIKIDPPLKDVQLLDVLDAIVKAADTPLKYSIEDYAVVFSPRSGDVQALYTRVFKVDSKALLKAVNSGAGSAAMEGPAGREVLEAVRGFFSRLGVDLAPPKTVFYKDRDGRLLVRATLQDLDKIERAIAALNQPPPQIHIQAKFIEIPEASVTGFWKDCGLEPMGTTNGARLLSAAQATAAFKAVQENPNCRLVHSPSLITLSDRQAQIQVAEVMTVVTNINPAALQLPGVSTTSTNGPGLYLHGGFQLGPTLNLSPRAVRDNQAIQLATIPTLTEFLGYDKSTTNVTAYVNGKKQRVALPQPRFHVSSLTNSAIVPDGGTLVLDGLVSEKISKTKDKIPVLGDIPGVGGLFRSESTSVDKRRMLVFITPTLIDPVGNRIHP